MTTNRDSKTIIRLIAKNRSISYTEAQRMFMDSFSFTFEDKRYIASRYDLVPDEAGYFVLVTHNDTQVVNALVSSLLSVHSLIDDWVYDTREFRLKLREEILAHWPLSELEQTMIDAEAARLAHKWHLREAFLKRTPVILEAQLLSAGGVDNWEGYDDAMEHYTPSDDDYKDAESFLEALQIAGVDNWDWYGASLEGLDTYLEYLNSIHDPSAAPSFENWKEAVAQEAAAEAARVAAAKAIEDAKPKPREVNGATEQAVFDYLALNHPEQDTQALFEKLIVEKRMWAHMVFPTEFTRATKEIKKGVENPLEVARAKLYELILKNGKFDELVRSTIAEG